MAVTFQPMPDLTGEQESALRESISSSGVLVPIVVDQHGRILDGHNRARIAADLGVECPREVCVVANDKEAGDLAVMLNCARRQLNREQQRSVIALEIVRAPDDSDRAIARRVGCDHKTVAAVRRPHGGEIPQSISRADAEQLTNDIREHLRAAQTELTAVVGLLLSNGIPPGEILLSLMRAREGAASQFDRDNTVGREAVGVLFDPVVGYLLDPGAVKAWAPEFSGLHPLPMTDEDVRACLAQIELLGEGATVV